MLTRQLAVVRFDCVKDVQVFDRAAPNGFSVATREFVQGQGLGSQ